MPDKKENIRAKMHQAIINRMTHIDSMKPEMKELVHSYGYHVVNQFICQGITKPNVIKHLVEVVLDEFSPTRGSFSKQGTVNENIEVGKSHGIDSQLQDDK